MKVPRGSDLASPSALFAACKDIWRGVPLGASKLKKLGCWNHPNIRLSSAMKKTIKEGLDIPRIWERFEEILPENRWLFGHPDILKCHPAYQSEDPIAKAQLVNLNVRVMSACQKRPKGERLGIEFMGLGGCDGIGASCYAYKRGEEVIIIDMGADPAKNSPPRLDLLPESWRTGLKAIVLTHLHADHAMGLLHYDRFNKSIDSLNLPRDLPIYCTPITAKLFGEVLSTGARDMDPYALGRTLDELIKRIRPLEYRTWKTVGSFSIKLVPVPHTPGAALVEMESPFGRLLHAVDFSWDRAIGSSPLDLSWLRKEDISVLVLETTYGSVEADEPSRQLRCPPLFKSFLGFLDQVLEGQRNRVLFPAFSFGRAQELADHLETHEAGMTVMAGAAYKLSDLIHHVDPSWKRYRPLRTDYLGYRNIIASHGWMLEETASHRIYYNDLSDGDVVVFTGYNHPQSVASDILSTGGRTNIRAVSFPLSAHASLSELLAIVAATSVSEVVLVHGMQNLKNKWNIDHILCKNGYRTHRPGLGEILTF